MTGDSTFIGEKGGIMFYPNTSVNIVKVNKLELKPDTVDEYETLSLEEAGKEEIREKATRNTVLFTSYAAIKNYPENSIERLRIQYFSLTDINTKIYVYRKQPNQDYYELLGSIEVDNRDIYDYNILNGHYYHYLAGTQVPMIEGSTPETIQSYYIYENKDVDGNPVYIQTFFDSWSICDIEEMDSEQRLYKIISDTWNLGNNLEVGDFSQNRGVYSEDTLSRYPKITMGKKDYTQGQFKGLLGNFNNYELWPEYRDVIDINGTNPLKSTDGGYKGNRPTIEKINSELLEHKGPPIIQNNFYGYTEKSDLRDPYSLEVEKLNQWKEFIGNGELKLLRDTKGHGWIVQISEPYNYNVNYSSNLKQTQISFAWKEVVDINSVAIISTE